MDSPTRKEPTTPTLPTRKPSSSPRVATGGLGVVPTTVPLQDLSGDKLIHTAPRMTFNEISVPSLGGIPLLAKLGQGGMGAVYYGIHPRLQQEVAVKVLPFELAEKNPAAIQRFFREAQLAASAKSPHLIGVMDVNQESGLFYLVMEFIAGASAQGYLREVLKTGATGLDEAIALDICIAACTGLAAAHAKGIIHRDVKPDNIMIPRDEHTRTLAFQRAKLADLGLARSVTLDQNSVTDSGACMGTPGYMAPEQAEDAKSCGKPTDVFAMGATLYAMLTGAAPFSGTQLFNVLKSTIEKPHKPIRDLRPDISAPTAELLDRCLTKDPDQRFVDGSALLAALNVCRTALSQPGQAREAVARLSELLSAKEVGETVPNTLQSTPPPSSNSIAKTKSRSLLWAALLLFSAGICAAGWHYAPVLLNGQRAQTEKSKELDPKKVQNDAALKEKIQLHEAASAQERVNKEEAEKLALDEKKRKQEATDAKEKIRQQEATAAQERLKKLEADKLVVEEESKMQEAARLRRLRDENRQAFSNAIPLAVEAKRRDDWGQVVKLLESKRALPDNADNPNNDAADALLTEAKVELNYQRILEEIRQLLAGEARDTNGCYSNLSIRKTAQLRDALKHASENKPDAPEIKSIQEKLPGLVVAADGKSAVINFGGGVRLELVRIYAGTFEMGSNDHDAFPMEKPAHTVQITSDYFIAKTETTQEQWIAVMGADENHSQWKGAKLPVENVSWDDTQVFFERLKEKLNFAGRLPTEAEWEYACRAGSRTKYHNGNSESDLAKAGWYNENSEGKTHEVGGKTPNAWGLYDMHGNVYEWCADWFDSDYKKSGQINPQGPTSGSFHVWRGGSWKWYASCCSSTYRSVVSSEHRTSDFGFRVAASTSSPKTP